MVSRYRNMRDKPQSVCPECGIYFYDPAVVICSVCRHATVKPGLKDLFGTTEGADGQLHVVVPKKERNKEPEPAPVLFVQWPKHLQEGRG